MEKVRVVSNVRGFLNTLFNDDRLFVNFIQKSKVYEINNRKKELLSKLIRSKLFDILGISQVIKNKETNYDYLFSFNRFVDSKLPYALYLENPTALYHYSIGRGESFLGRRFLKKHLENKRLLEICCMSKACETTFTKLCNVGDAPNFKLETIYPLVLKNSFFKEELLREKIEQKKLKLIYIAQGKRFISKGGLEVIKLMEKINNRHVSLTIISNKRSINKEIWETIEKSSNINFIEFNLTYDKLERVYFDHHILLHPTSDDSSCLTILEAMKAGLPVISTNLYAIPEMVVDGYNGYLTTPKYYFFDEDNLPNKKVWNNREETIYSEKNIDNNIINFMNEKIAKLDSNRGLLMQMSLNSYKKATVGEFSEEWIIRQWNNVFLKENK